MPTIKHLSNITITVGISNVLKWRLRAFVLLMRLACWVGSIGDVEFVELTPEPQEHRPTGPRGDIKGGRDV